MISYIRLRHGGWGICAHTSLREGQSVIVTRKDGSFQQERVGKVLFTEYGGVTIASICQRARTQGRAAALRRGRGAPEAQHVDGKRARST